jgi:drug/metabolite transporter (DMT)-like permease
MLTCNYRVHVIIHRILSYFILFYSDQLPIEKFDTTTTICAITTGLEIGLSTSSLKYVTLTFYTMVKSGAPIFVLLFAFITGIEKPSYGYLDINIQVDRHYCNHSIWSIFNGC